MNCDGRQPIQDAFTPATNAGKRYKLTLKPEKGKTSTHYVKLFNGSHILTESRVSSAPSIPTVPELGYKLPYVPFMAIFGPKKLPDEAAKRIEEVVRKITANKDFQNKAVTVGLEVSYEDTATLEKNAVQFKENAYKFFKQEGMVK